MSQTQKYMGFKKFLIYFVCLLAVLWGDILYAVVRPSHYQTLLRLTQELEQRCPEQTCVLVGLGRSPTPLLAFLQSRGRKSMTQLPLSGFKVYRESNELTEEKEQRLFHHFDRYLGNKSPSGNLVEGKSILVTDFLASGFGLMNARRYIQKYVIARGYGGQVEMFGFTHKPQRLDASFPRDSALLLDSADALMRDLDDQGFDDASEYGKFDLLKGTAQGDFRPVVNSKYQDLVNVFLALKEDIDLQGHLKESQLNKWMSHLLSSNHKDRDVAILALGLYRGNQVDFLRAGFASEERDVRTAVMRLAFELTEQSQLANQPELTCEYWTTLLRNLDRVSGLASDDHKRIEELVTKGADPRMIAEVLVAPTGVPTTVRVSAAWKLGGMNPEDPEIHLKLIQALRHGNADIRLTAEDALLRINPEDRAVHLALADALRDISANVRTSAVRLLGEIHSSHSEIHLALGNALGDSDDNVRFEAVVALGKVRPTEQEVLFQLVEKLRDDALIVRLAAKKALSLIKPEYSSEMGRCIENTYPSPISEEQLKKLLNLLSIH